MHYLRVPMARIVAAPRRPKPNTRTNAMIDHRPFASLGHADHGWLDSRHHFSFASYHDPDRMGWGALRVWNDDEIAPRNGFPAHPHRDMEIITYVRQGAITHKDSLGNEGRTEAGDVQVMSAGSGVRHSEFNLEDETTRLFQLWIFPREDGLPPSWGAKPFPRGARSGTFVPLASGFAEDAEALPIRADARVLGADAEGRRERDLCARCQPPRLSRHGEGRGRGQRRPPRRARWRRHHRRDGADRDGERRRRTGACRLCVMAA